jgi:hypothetical protein
MPVYQQPNLGQVVTYPLQGGQVANNRHLAVAGPVGLPWGGPIAGSGLPGNAYPMLSALTLVGGAAQPEVWTLSLTGTGTFNFLWAANTTYQSGSLSATTTTAAQLLTALQNIWPSWVLPAGSVTGSTGGPFTITFGGSSGYNGSGAYSRIGGVASFSTTGSAVATLTRGQRGSVGAGQYDYADGVTFTTCSAFLIENTPTGATGSLDTVPYGPTNYSAWTPSAWLEGFFFANYQSINNALVTISPNLTDAIVAASPKLTYVVGSTLETPGAQLRLLQ